MALTAAIVAVGSEMLGLGREDTNGPHITERLLDVGVSTLSRVVVADDRRTLVSVLRAALDTADVVVVTGGLGPTCDDLTREATAQALDRGLRRDPAALDTLRQRFAHYGRTMAAVNEQQADVIEGAILLPNPIGTAPGQYLDLGAERSLFLLPGPPHEMKGLLESDVLPALRERAGGTVIARRQLRVAATGESDVEQIAGPIYSRVDNPRTTILSAAGDVELDFVATDISLEAAQDRADALAREVESALGARVYSDDGRRLHEVVAGLLAEQGRTLALAESCTGGLIAGRLTAVPGASTFLDRGFVTYSNASKAQELAIDPALIERHGAVSEEVARAMANGARRVAQTDVGIGVTGIAGPDGGTPEKPVGLVYIALAGLGGDIVRRCRFVGERERVRVQAVQVALELLRRALLGLPPL